MTVKAHLLFFNASLVHPLSGFVIEGKQFEGKKEKEGFRVFLSGIVLIVKVYSSRV